MSCIYDALVELPTQMSNNKHDGFNSEMIFWLHLGSILSHKYKEKISTQEKPNKGRTVSDISVPTKTALSWCAGYSEKSQLVWEPGE